MPLYSAFVMTIPAVFTPSSVKKFSMRRNSENPFFFVDVQCTPPRFVYEEKCGFYFRIL